MTLEDFERALAENKSQETHKRRHRSRSRDRHDKDSERRHRHHHHHSSRHHRSRDDDEDESSHRHKRSRRERHDEREDEHRSSRHRDSKHRSSRRHHDGERDREHRSSGRHRSERDRSKSPADDDEEYARWAEQGNEETTSGQAEDKNVANVEGSDLKRDSWMEAPSALDVDYIHRKRQPEPDTKATKKDFELKIHENELNQHLRDIQEGGADQTMEDEPAQHEVSYTFGDNGSQWRMTKLKNVYREAKDSGRPIDDVALDRFGSLRDFDDAREEENELDRRKMYGPDYVGKEKPSGELFQERKLNAGIRRGSAHEEEGFAPDLPQGQVMEEKPAPATTVILDQTALNKLKAKMMKAKLRGAPDAAALEAEYNEAMAAAANRKEPEVVVLGAAENRLLASRKGEVTELTNKRGRERGLVKENEDMSIEDMVRQEKRTKGQSGGEGYRLAERIAKDTKFTDDLEYMDDNANKLAKHVQKSGVNLRNVAIEDFQKMNRILDSCPLCHHEDSATPPVAPVVSLGTRVFMTLPTEPEISEGGACIVPIQHRFNLLECDDDEWEEIRNFMKCLTRMYHDQGRDVVFYENAASPHRKRHAAMMAVPIPYSLGETAPAFFREAILAADEEWTQHKKLINTQQKAREGMGRQAFRRSIAKEMPYFHAWFDLDGGLGHIVEDANRWPKGDLFARELLGGMLDLGPDVIKRQGRWHRNDRRVEGFRKKWRKFDWTRVLTDG
ncbi:putative cell cycle control protein [Phyllosticta capitalensis]|uniref:Cell cycle control protein n=1 Tax=Phyllosticta capitalensis TaxID=121624 RepID=A0ABR1YUM5_9PEZI